MRKVLLSMLFIGVATYANAQKSEVTKAKSAWALAKFSVGKSQTLDATLKSLNEGLKSTDLAIANEKSKDMPEAWSYRALFASRIALVDTLNMENAVANDKIAEEAITKAKALDTKGAEKENIQEAEEALSQAVAVRANYAYKKKDYKSALVYFNQLAAKNPQDTMSFVNAGIVAREAQDYPDMIKNFKQAINLGYKDGEALYAEMITTTLGTLKDTVAGTALLEEASVKYPDNVNFIANQTDLYVKKGDGAKAQEMLAKLIAKDDKNPSYQNAMGNIFFNQAFALQTERNKIDPKNKKEFDTVTAKLTGLLDQATPYYKKAYELDPKVTDPLERLVAIYAFKNDKVNYDAAKKLLDDAKK